MRTLYALIAAVLLSSCGLSSSPDGTASAEKSTFYMAATNKAPPCQGTELATASKAMTDARRILNLAIAALQSTDPGDQQRGQTWLGLRSTAEADSVRATLIKARTFANSASLRCSVIKEPGVDEKVYAYVDPSKAFVIVLGLSFWDAPDTGFSSKGGTLVHELSHFNLVGAAKDPPIYGMAAARQLASSNPTEAQRNAENIEYFVEAVGYQL